MKKSEEKSKAQLKAERRAIQEAQRATNTVAENVQKSEEKSKAQLKAERRAIQEAQRATNTVAENVQKSEEKSKAQLKAERRVIQEAQRAAKAAKDNKPNQQQVQHEEKPKPTSSTETPESKVTPNSSTKISKVPSSNKEIPEPLKTVVKTTTTVKSTKRIQLPLSKVQALFTHLPKKIDVKSLLDESKKGEGVISKDFVTLAIKFSTCVIQGSNNRCTALIHTIQQFLDTFVTPPGKDFKQEFPPALKKNLEFLRKSRPFAVAMDNLVDFVNTTISHQDMKGETDMKEELKRELTSFIDDKITKAREAIVINGKAKVNNGDVILIYGSAQVVEDILLEATEDKSFAIIIVDERSPNDNSRNSSTTRKKAKSWAMINEMYNRNLIKTGRINISYMSITSVSNYIQRVTKIFIGAHALLANGGVVAHAGTSQIALLAHLNNIPVLVCCETYKFCDKSPTDSFCINEVCYRKESCLNDDDRSIVNNVPYNVDYFHAPVIKYDLTPPELVTAVITDVDILPCSSVPVVLRVQEHRPKKL